MIKTSRQLKDLIRNMAKGDSGKSQLLIRNCAMDEIKTNSSMREFWGSYQRKNSYAADIAWETVMNAIYVLCDSCAAGLLYGLSDNSRRISDAKLGTKSEKGDLTSPSSFYRLRRKISAISSFSSTR